MHHHVADVREKTGIILVSPSLLSPSLLFNDGALVVQVNKVRFAPCRNIHGTAMLSWIEAYV